MFCFFFYKGWLINSNKISLFKAVKVLGSPTT
jgi:hypothetical protein